MGADDPGTEGEIGSTEASARRLRLARRRWRLWWRFQLRAIPFRRPLRRVRVLRTLDEDPVARPAQLAVGRLLGRGYLRWRRLNERAKIARARIPDRVEPAQTTLSLIRLQAPLLGALVVLIATGFALDALARGLGVEIARWLGIESWLRETLTRPSDETMRNLLAASAAGTATILGLVLSISLIAWQATADRYRSTSIVAFLLRERVGSAVVRLLALGFAYSLFVLALLEVFPDRPYVSAVLALAISTAAVLSLLSYRQAGLLGYLPVNIARSLRLEISRELRRARRPNAGRSVEDYARRVVREDLQIIGDLLRRLRDEEEPADLAACLNELARTLAHYLTVKHELRTESLFFERRKEPLGDGGLDIEDQIVGEGLMDPFNDVPDHLWVERRVLEIVRDAMDWVPDDISIAESLIGIWSLGLQHAWYRENHEAVELILAEVEKAASSSTWRQDASLAEQFATISWLIAEAVGNGWQTSAEQIVAAEPWEGERHIRDLPWRARDQARDLATRVKREIVIAGQVVTPRVRMIDELSKVRDAEQQELRDEFVRRALRLCEVQLSAAVQEKSLTAAVTARITLRVFLRLAHHRIPPPDVTNLSQLVLEAIDLADEDDTRRLTDDAGRAARALAQVEQWVSAYALLRVAEVAWLLGRLEQTDDAQNLYLAYDGFFLAAVIYAWGEYNGAKGHLKTSGLYVQAPYANLDGLKILADERKLTTVALPSIAHYRWFQPLTQAAYALPDIPYRDGGIGFGVKKDHPSELFASSELMFGPEECLSSLILAVHEQREAGRERLVLTLKELLLQRQESK